ncbi:MAG: double-strand break repair helicase AddA, partial [Rhodospirillales bacterium]|nr:double-strand break repair helicase AddA [Rhodospirillales bacterium]
MPPGPGADATARSPRARANADQRAAADPAVSAFVAASAGSGKTKLLTDRLLRLMLGGAAPERILCLTFTKAAAAEMALRLQRRLGAWVTLDDAALGWELAALDVPVTDAACRRARALFARVLDMPGGMRIGTIHAFCQSLLRRFPLEAQISPHFQLVDDRDAADALAEAAEDMLRDAGIGPRRAALETLAGLVGARDFQDLLAGLLARRDRLDPALALGPGQLEAAQRRVLGVTATNEAELIAGAVTWPGEAALRAALARIAAGASPKCRERATELLGWLGCGAADRAANWDDWVGGFLRDGDQPRGDGAFINPKLAAAAPELLAACRAEADRVIAVQDARRALGMAALSAALLRLAAPVATAYAARKEASGRLDYDDLIDRTRGLLANPGAAWVLYKLDGGLDHLLLDEVQDTAPAQWRIAEAITDEFFAGLGARDGARGQEAPAAPRSVFAVGDRKQSIFSFQGADAAAFDRSRLRLGARVRQAGLRWEERPLDVSFRSTVPVLELVDAVFADPIAAAGVAPPGTLRHFADRAGHAGAVELWPLAPPPGAEEPAPWTVPGGYQSQGSGRQILAETLARWIAAQIGRLELPARGRRLRAGDVMVLVRRRDAFARALLRALKSAGVPAAGLDRMVLTDQPAVADLLVLADALLLPEDDLAFGCFLTSPLGGLTDASLMDLAIDRSGSLAEALRSRAGDRPEWERAWRFFGGLLSRVDYASPHALLAEALGPLGGRARLFARLGAEAGEPVDELLAAALEYGRTHPPALQGFVHWLRRSAAEVKREQEAAGETVRILTVHGAKGLQAPFVILPDTTGLPPDNGTLLWGEDRQTGVAVPLWAPRKSLRCAAADQLRAQISARGMEEHNRLLYVALTRAEDRLLVCGWAPSRPLPESCWYSAVARGFARLPAVTEPFGPPLASWSGSVLRHEIRQSAEPGEAKGQAAAVPPALPAWLGAAPDWRAASLPPEPARPQPLAPSRP